MTNNAPNYINIEGFSLLDLFTLLIKNIRILVLLSLFFPTVTIVYLFFFSTPVYISSAKFMPSDSNYPERRLDDLRNKYNVILSSSRIKDVKWSYVDIIKSRTLLYLIIKHEFYTKLYGVKTPLSYILLEDELDISKYNKNEIEFIAVEKLRRMIDIREDINTFILTLNVSAFEPQLASDIADLLIQELDNQQRNFNNRRNNDVIELIEKRLSNSINELSILEDKLKLFKNQNRMMGNSPNLIIEENRLVREIKIISNVVSTLSKKYEETKIESFKEIDYLIIIDSPEPPLYRTKPKKKNALLASVILSLGFGIIAILFKEYLNNLKIVEKEKFSQIKKLLKSSL